MCSSNSRLLGPGVTDAAIGDRVSYCMVLGSYATRRVIAADRLIRLDDRTSDETAAYIDLDTSTTLTFSELTSLSITGVKGSDV